MIIKNNVKQNEVPKLITINATSNLIRRAKSITIAIIVSTTMVVGMDAQNVFSSQDNMNSYIEPIPIKEIHKSGNAIYVNGEKFNLIRAPANKIDNGTINNPYVKFSPLRVEITNVNNPQMAYIINSNMLSRIKLLYKEGPIEFSYNKFNTIGAYDGLGYYAFQIAIDLSGVAQALGNNKSSLMEKVFWIETPKKCTYIHFISDLNAIYNFTKNSPLFYGMSNVEFINACIKSNDYLHHYRFMQYTLKDYYTQKHVMSFDFFGHMANMDFSREVYHPLVELQNFPKKDMYCIYRNINLIYVRNYIPAMGDGTKEFPYIITKNAPHYYGVGYYSFEDITVYGGAHIEYPNIIKSKKELKHIYREIYPNKELLLKKPESNINKIFYCINVDGYSFIYNQSLLFNNIWKIRSLLYQDGTIGHPYLSIEFTKPGRYNINNIITPLAKSKDEYLKFKNIIQKNKFLNSIYSGKVNTYSYYNSQIPGAPSGILLKSIEEEAKATHGKIVYKKNAIYVVSKNGMLVYNIPGYPNVMSKQKVEMLKKKLDNSNPILFNNSNVPTKLINGVKFYLVHNNNSSRLRDGSQDDPFIAQRGPVGTTPFFYQFSGTDFETSQPINGLKMQKFFDALNIPMHMFAASNIEKINGFLIYKRKSGVTFNFGTLYQPEPINKHYMYRFESGIPACFIVKSPLTGQWYVNLKPIDSLHKLNEFYHAITGSNLGPILFTHDGKYKIDNNGRIERLSTLRR